MEINQLIGKGRFGYVYSGKLKHWDIALKFSSSATQLEIEKAIYLYLRQTQSQPQTYRVPFFFH